MTTPEEFVLEAEILRSEVKKLASTDQRCIDCAVSELRHVVTLYGNHGVTALALLSTEIIEKGGLQ